MKNIGCLILLAWFIALIICSYIDNLLFAYTFFMFLGYLMGFINRGFLK